MRAILSALLLAGGAWASYPTSAQAPTTAADPPAAPGAAPTAAPAPAAAGGAGGVSVNLNVTPRRVTFDRAARSATVYVFNQGDAPSTFDVSLVDRVMLPDGQIQTVEQARTTAAAKAVADRLRSAHDMVMATPRRVTLAPGKGQTIRLRATPPTIAADGSGDGAAEYRTHLTVTNIPPPDTGLTAEEAASRQPNELVFRVRSVVAISIPVIVRTAPIDARARIENARLTQVEQRLQPGAAPQKVAAVTFDIVRTGASSLFGNAEVRAGPKGAESVGLARGVGVYPEIDRRSFQMILKRTPRPGETLTILFTDDDGHPGAELARASLEVH